MTLNAILNKLANNGIDGDTPFALRNKLRVFNNANLAIFGINAFYVTIGLVQHYLAAVAVTFFALSSSILTYFFIKYGKYKLAFNYTLIYGFVFLTAFSLLFGGANNSYYYFLFIPVACNILFDNVKVTLAYVLVGAALMIFNIYYVEHYKPYYNIEEWMRYFSYPNILFSSMLIFMGVRLFKQENQKYAHQIEDQKKVLEEKNKEITDSINYAQKIQSALIPSMEEFSSHFRESFVLFKPKDIVSGDFYWITKKDDHIFYVTGDCTGHGVPGGFMTMLGISFLDEIINEKHIIEPAEILNALRDRLIHTLKQTGNAGENKDGMDMVLCRINLTENSLCYSSANNSLYILRDAVLKEYKGDKQPCGFHHQINSFSQQEIKLKAGDSVFAFTDGYPDQFGGPRGKKYKYKQLEEVLLAHSHHSFKKQCEILDLNFSDWKGELEQIDDVCVVGIKI